jgi:signal transduction histidine kinase
MSDRHRILGTCLGEFPRAVLEVSATGSVRDSNGRLERMLGCKLIGRPLAEVLDPTSQGKWARLLSGVRDEPRSITEDEPLELVFKADDTLRLTSFLASWSDGAEPKLWLLEHARDPKLESMYETLARVNTELVETQRSLARERARLAGAYEQERLARLDAERRAAQESALRGAAAAVSENADLDDVIREIARGAVLATGADTVLAERLHLEECEVEVVATAGRNLIAPGTRLPYGSSLTSMVVDRGEPELIADLSDTSRPLPAYLADDCAGCSALVIPVVDSGIAIDVLVLLRRHENGPFQSDEVDRARTFGDLTVLTLRKIKLIEETAGRSAELEQAMESRARLLRGFTHDVKNPLGAADGLAELLETGVFGELTPLQSENVARMRRSIRGALSLIEALTSLARTESARVELNHAPVDLRSVVGEMVEEYQAVASGAGLNIELDVPKDLPPVQTDAERVGQILGNLLSNAIKYTPAGGTIKVGVHPPRGHAGRDRNPCVPISVTDSGPGIPRELWDRLFEEFVRFETAGKPGAGVGLAISRRLARALGGNITIDSQPGRGSTFTLWLPTLAHPG